MISVLPARRAMLGRPARWLPFVLPWLRSAESDRPAGRPARLTAVAASAREAPITELYHAHRLRLVRLAVLMVDDLPTAEDIVQDAFVQLFSRFDGLSEPTPYLYRSVVNGGLSRHRRRRVAERLAHLTVPNAVTSFEMDETWSALERLPARRRAAVILRYYEDLPLAEIAQILGCRTGTVKSMLHRALSELKEVLDP
jgi:RNA polymerase sigma-70 factor (sigma-E family)